jgi:hypothetical protein
MIQCAYVIGSTGEVVFTKSYHNEEGSTFTELPDFADTIITLYQNSESTRKEHVYFHERENQIWAFVFFDQFVIVLETSSDEDKTSTTRRIISMGRTLASKHTGLESTESTETTIDFAAIVDRYIELEFAAISEALLAVMELITYTALEKYNIAYAGIFNAQGQQIKGNIPENHARKIGVQVSQGTIKPSVDVVPWTAQIDGYEAQLLTVQYLTVVAAPYRDSSKLPATRAVGEMAESLRDALMKINTTSK